MITKEGRQRVHFQGSDNRMAITINVLFAIKQLTLSNAMCVV